MKASTKVILTNTIIILCLLCLNFVTTTEKGNHILGRFAFAGIFILLTGLVNIGIGIGKLADKKEEGQSFILFGGIILVIGFSVCTVLA